LFLNLRYRFGDGRRAFSSANHKHNQSVPRAINAPASAKPPSNPVFGGSMYAAVPYSLIIAFDDLRPSVKLYRDGPESLLIIVFSKSHGPEKAPPHVVARPRRLFIIRRRST